MMNYIAVHLIYFVFIFQLGIITLIFDAPFKLGTLDTHVYTNKLQQYD
jgi:hypothetical protein